MMPARLAVDDDESSISCRGNIVTVPGADLAHHRLIGAEQQLLAGLAAGVERARHLRAAERPVVEQAAVLPGERHALGHALVDDVVADLREAVHVGFARAVVAALDRVVEQPRDAVAVVAVVLGRVDAALRRDAVRAPRAVLDAEAEDVVAGFAQRGRRGAARQARAHDDDGELPAVGRVHQLGVETVLVPLVGHRSRRNLRVELPRAGRGNAWCAAHDRPPMKNNQIGMEKNPAPRITAMTLPAFSTRGVRCG